MIPIDIWLVEDDAGYRRNLRRSLDREKHITCSRVFPSCIEFLEAIQSGESPDLVLMDLGLPGMSGVEGIQRLKSLEADVTVLAMDSCSILIVYWMMVIILQVLLVAGELPIMTYS